jgi:hypothetical protein
MFGVWSASPGAEAPRRFAAFAGPAEAVPLLQSLDRDTASENRLWQEEAES